MSAFRFNNFSGERPRLSINLIPEGGAQVARNVRFDDGALTPLRAPSASSSFAAYPGGYKTIYRNGDTWLGWSSIVNAVPGPVASDRLYVTGDGAPKMIVSGTTYDLAVPIPADALTTITSGTGTGDVISRVYVATYVTAYGEESEPCAASPMVNWQSGLTVTLSGFAAIPAGRNITKQRIYRTQTGDSGTDLYFIAERVASTSDFTDDIADDAFGEVLPSRTYNAPPDGLAGLVSMPNGMMAAYDSANPRNLYFCEPFLPHAWPEAYVLTTDADIVALGAIGTSLIIMTKGNPYFAQGTDPSSMQMVKTQSNYPCVNARGVQDMGFAIAYPTHEGLALATGDGAVTLTTTQLFNQQEWEAFSPATFCSGQLNGLYLAAYDTADPDGNLISGTLIIHVSPAGSFISRSDLKVQAFFYSLSDSALYYLVEENGAIMRFDPPDGIPLSQYWYSRPILLPDVENIGVIRIDALTAQTAAEAANISAARASAIADNQTALAAPLGSEISGHYIMEFTIAGDGLASLPEAARNVIVGVYADGNAVAKITDVNKAVRLPSGFKARRWEVDVFGTMQMHQVALARTIGELRSMGMT